jgi:hypothetical protein
MSIVEGFGASTLHAYLLSTHETARSSEPPKSRKLTMWLQLLDHVSVSLQCYIPDPPESRSPPGVTSPTALARQNTYQELTRRRGQGDTCYVSNGPIGHVTHMNLSDTWHVSWGPRHPGGVTAPRHPQTNRLLTFLGSHSRDPTT